MSQNKARFSTPLFKNYDYGISDKNGPGTGLYQNLDKYKSVKDFIKSKRKRNKNKYKVKARMKLLSKLTKIAIDFPYDNDVTYIIGDTESYNKPNQLGPGIGNSETFPSVVNLGDYESYSTPIGIGGLTDKYLPQNDFEGKSPEQLDFGRDYVPANDESPDYLQELFKKYLSPAEPPLFGMPDGINTIEDLDAPSNENPQYGILDTPTDIYTKMWI